jgi:hypothetical protein
LSESLSILAHFQKMSLARNIRALPGGMTPSGAAA